MAYRSDEERTSVTFLAPRELLERFDAIAEKEHRDRSKHLTWLMEQHVQEHGDDGEGQ